MSTSLMPHTNEYCCSVSLCSICHCIFSATLPAIRRIDTRGRHTGASREICVVSADVAGLPRSILCRFGGLSRRSRLSFQR